MRTIIFSLALLIGSQSAMAATITARVSATILSPVKVSLQQQTMDRDYASIQHDLKVESAQGLSFDTSRKASDVCLFETSQLSATGKPQLLASSCESVVVNFN